MQQHSIMCGLASKQGFLTELSTENKKIKYKIKFQTPQVWHLSTEKFVTVKKKKKQPNQKVVMQDMFKTPTALPHIHARKCRVNSQKSFINGLVKMNILEIHSLFHNPIF